MYLALIFYQKPLYLPSEFFESLKSTNMQAIVSIAGQQFKVEEGQEIFVHQLAAEKGEEVAFSEVLMTLDGDNVAIGTPNLGLTVKATVLDHLKADKVIVFKKKRRKGYRKKNGHRQSMSKIKILSIA